MSIATLIRSAPEGHHFGDGELEAWRGLLRAHTSVAKRLDSALEGAHGLPLRAYEVLHLLAGAPHEKMRMSDLAEEAQLSRSGLTRLVDRLERDGLLVRCSCPHDARGAYACLTADGAERLQSAQQTHRAIVHEHFLSRFSAHELNTLSEMWSRIAPGAPGNGQVCGPAGHGHEPAVSPAADKATAQAESI